jgi:phosphonate transport system permease protein
MSAFPTLQRDAPLPHRDPAALRRWATLLVAAVLLWPLLVWTEFQPWTLWDARSLKVAGRFIASFIPPRHDAEFLRELAFNTWRTVAIATAGLTLAMLVAVPAALAVSTRLSISALAGHMAPLPAALRQLLRWALVVLRSIPELVWALVFVRVVGLGPTAGVLAIGIAYGGMLGKVYAEILDSQDAAPSQALLRSGCGRLQAFVFGALPQAAGELLSYTVYRWECAVRSSVVLGCVGAGGLGQMLDTAAKMFAGPEVSAILIVFMLLVAGSDRLSAWLRGMVE